MKSNNGFYVCLVTMLLILAACTAPSEQETADSVQMAAEVEAPSDPLTGMWSGDWGPSAQDRNPVMLELMWDGANLSGTVNPGPDAVELSTASFSPDTGTIMMEADAEGRGGGMIHYTIEGMVEGNTMTGSWSHDDVEGDFAITKN